MHKFCITFALIALAPLTAVSQQRAVQEARFAKITPLGADAIRLMPANKILGLMVSVESAKLRNARVLNVEGRKVVEGGDGNEIKNYPDDLSFRVTITDTPKNLESLPMTVDTKVGPGELSTNLRFKLHRFSGLESEDFKPEKSEMIGMPANVPYNERIYRVKFKTGEFSIDDRLMLEILAPDGTRIAKFHFFLK